MKLINNVTDTKIFALGGLGEVGKNMYCIMTGNEIIITDNTGEIKMLSWDLKEAIDKGGMTIVFPVGLKKINKHK